MKFKCLMVGPDVVSSRCQDVVYVRVPAVAETSIGGRLGGLKEKRLARSIPRTDVDKTPGREFRIWRFAGLIILHTVRKPLSDPIKTR